MFRQGDGLRWQRLIQKPAWPLGERGWLADVVGARGQRSSKGFLLAGRKGPELRGGGVSGDVSAQWAGVMGHLVGLSQPDISHHSYRCS